MVYAASGAKTWPNAMALSTKSKESALTDEVNSSLMTSDNFRQTTGPKCYACQLCIVRDTFMRYSHTSFLWLFVNIGQNCFKGLVVYSGKTLALECQGLGVRIQDE